MLGEVFGYHLGRSPELLGLFKLLVLLLSHSLQAAFAVPDLEIAVPRLADGDGMMREFGADPDLIHDRVVTEPKLEGRIVLHAGSRAVDSEDARHLLLRFFLEAIQRRHPVDLLAPDRP